MQVETAKSSKDSIVVERAIFRGRDRRTLIQVHCPTYDQAMMLLKYLH